MRPSDQKAAAAGGGSQQSLNCAFEVRVQFAASNVCSSMNVTCVNNKDKEISSMPANNGRRSKFR